MLVHASGGRGGLIVVLVLLLNRELWGQRIILHKRVDWVGNIGELVVDNNVGEVVDETLWKAVVV